MVAGLTVEHCACDQVSTDCEHAGEICARPDDCSDCLVPCDSAALADAPVALPPPANVLVGVPLLVPILAHGERCAIETNRPIFISRSFTFRPPTFRAGTMCMRV